MNTMITEKRLYSLLSFYLLIFLTCVVNFSSINQYFISDVPNVFEGYNTLFTTLHLLSIFSILVISFVISLHLSKRFFAKLTTVIFIYLLSNHFILITRNLNNKKFNVFDVSIQSFFQINGLIYLINIILISLFMYFILKWKNTDKYFDHQFIAYESNRGNILISIMISILFFKNNQIGLFFHNLVPDLTKAEYFIAYNYNILKAVIIITLISLLITFTLLRSIGHTRKLNPSFSLSFITSLGLSVIFNFALQYGIRADGELLGKFIFPGATVFQIGFLFFVFQFCYLITNRYFPTTIMIVLLGVIASIANTLKQSMRSEPLLITDLSWLREIGLISSFVNKNLVVQIIIGIIFAMIMAYLLQKHVLSGPIISNWQFRLILTLLTISGFLFFYLPFYQEEDGNIPVNVPIISVLNNQNDINWLGFSTTARYKSMAYVWTKQLTNKVMSRPRNYSREEINKIVEKYTLLSQKINFSRQNLISNQTVIYVLSESFSDPNRFSDVSISRDVLPNIKLIKDSTTSGLMHSDTFGGGTANMEFQSLIGLPFYNFSPSVSVLYSEVFPKMKIQPSISNQFEPQNRIALHPADANNFNRKSVYKTLKFKHFFASSGSDDSFKKIEKVGLLPSDKMVYQKVLSEINPSTSQFFSVITMQNHIPWSSDFPSDINAKGNGFTDEQNNNLTSYARLLTFTDTETKDFLDALLKIDKPITVVFYGDHLPGFYPDSVFLNDFDQKFQTDYFIWSNKDQIKLNYPLINSSDLTAVLLDHTNSKVSPYYALLTEVLKSASVNSDKDSIKYQSIQNDLKNIQYDMTVGKSYILENNNFFKINE